MKDFISIKDLEPRQINEILSLTKEVKDNKEKFKDSLKGKTFALIFQKPSNRTRVSFAVGIFQMGGLGIYLGPDELSVGVRESIEDVAKTLSRYVDAIIFRTFAHDNVLKMAQASGVPVINALSDLEHPCQALADIYTIREKLGGFKPRTLAYIGDGNNVAHSLLYAASKVGLNINIASPKGYQPDKDVIKQSEGFASLSGAEINISSDPFSACRGVDIVYTDVWTSMGEEAQAGKRRKIFKGFQVNEKLISNAKPSCMIMHCLPAHRGEEITADLLDSRRSIVFDQAENRLHAQKAILLTLMKK